MSYQSILYLAQDEIFYNYIMKYIMMLYESSGDKTHNSVCALLLRGAL